MKKRFSKVITVCIIIAVCLLGFIWFEQRNSGKLEVTFFDVGQGDSILIETPYQQQILIDGGPDNSVLSRLGRRLPFYDRSLDLVILTHADADHLTGLVEVLKRYQVEKVITSGVEAHSATYDQWLLAIKEQKIEMEIITEAKRYFFADDCWLDILYPDQDFGGQQVKELNSTSIVSQLDCEGQKFFFPGDLPSEQEEYLVKKGINLQAEVLKVAHHGSKNSSPELFLEAVSPKFAVIQVGQKNKFGHPHQIVLWRLQQIGAEILRTDQQGTITFYTKNGQLFYQTEY